MGFVRSRTDKAGRTRHTAYHLDLHKKERSAGTFARLAEAEHAWQDAEALLRGGRHLDVEAGRTRFGHYVSEVWLPTFSCEARTAPPSTPPHPRSKPPCT